jgi:hypothetical protein
LDCLLSNHRRTSNMKLNLLGLSMLATLLFACTYDLFMVKRDETLSQYASAIRWGNYEKAVGFQNPARRTRLDEAWLKNIHVATYDTLFLKAETNSKILEQTVEIRYFNEQAGVEKTITDHQVWHFDEDRDKWMLETDLPAFR